MPLYLHENRQKTQARVPHYDFYFFPPLPFSPSPRPQPPPSSPPSPFPPPPTPPPIPAIFAIASSSGTGTSLPSRIARENASPCTVYWLQVGIICVVTPLPRASLPSSTKISHGRSFGALKGILISIRPLVPKNCMRWYRTSCVPHPNTASPEGHSNIAQPTH